ncbi:DinB family protein [Myroides fluvii]|uniref:DinB family protein n=1 Tax=Myroides fluvii TaxID=2572594 RepID=UPI00131C3583|nr:DinB family protein [Myroides fluvii]
METTKLLSNLLELTHQIKREAQAFQALPDSLLSTRPQPASWSILECMEHLNRYGYFYIPEITIKINTSPYTTPSKVFKSGYLGNYFAKSMLPKAKLNKMKTFKSMNPSTSKVDREVLSIFIQQQNSLIALLEQAKTVDLNKTKTSISISKWIKLRLGDTFKIVVFHNLRHLKQAQNIVNNQREFA